MKKISLPYGCLIGLFLVFYLQGLAQVPVVDEPRHKVILANKYVRLIDVWIEPGDTTLYHIHATASAVVLLSKTVTGSQLLGGVPSSSQQVPGNSFFAAYNNKPITHRVWNQDTVVFHVMDIELLQPGSENPSPALNGPEIQLRYEEKMVRVYGIHLGPGQKLEIKAGPCPHLLIPVTGQGTGKIPKETSSSGTKRPAGKFEWYPAQKSFQLDADLSKNSDFVLLEFK